MIKPGAKRILLVNQTGHKRAQQAHLKGEEKMFYQEQKIAQAEFANFNASFNQPAIEGATVTVPNLFDRLAALLKNALMSVNAKPSKRDANLSRGATAWQQVRTALEIGRDKAYLSHSA
jgi:hypothetical protein